MIVYYQDAFLRIDHQAQIILLSAGNIFWHFGPKLMGNAPRTLEISADGVHDESSAFGDLIAHRNM